MCRFLVCCLVCVIVLLSRLCDCVAVSPAAWSHSCHLPSPSRHSQKSASSVLQFGYTMLLEPVSGHTRPTHHPLVLLQKIPQRLLVTILEYLILQQERKCQKSQHHSLLIEPSGFNLVLNTHSTPITFLSVGLFTNFHVLFLSIIMSSSFIAITHFGFFPASQKSFRSSKVTLHLWLIWNSGYLISFPLAFIIFHEMHISTC
ncbi:uncharacterized protein LOC111902115 isoform X1 [Lactuca sativa]|uniref:uncharacterized protein LOC111902115 isoform X1 n=1 Tax=Lactuca sativa TaxID=4236 RepID=UPI001C691D0C|nr:uncharacterized protein LOC111902115 isoform X1 [Lactuca sativa]